MYFILQTIHYQDNQFKMLHSYVCYVMVILFLILGDNFGILPGGDAYDETGKDENKGIVDKEEIEGRTDKQDSSPIVYIMGRPGLLAGT